MKHFNFLKFFLASILLSFMISTAFSQVKMDTIWTTADVTLGSGTGQALGDYKSRNFGADGSMEMCNFDDNEALMSYFEAWCKFDLTEVAASIPDGQDILYTQLLLRISANTGQGYYAYHLKDIDDWEEGNGDNNTLSTEGGLTWDDAQLLDYENEANYTLLRTVPLEPALFDEFDVTSAVKYELGDDGNKIMTLRFSPYITEYDEVTSPKAWLGFWSRQSPWGSLHPDLNIAVDAPHLVFYIGSPEPKDFSDIANYGNIDNYTKTPSKYGYWLVREDEGDARLIIAERPSPISATPGGIAVYDQETYGDFDISVKAKLNKIKSEALDPAADFAIVFGYKNSMEYSYMLFTGEDKNGFYTVDTIGGLHKTEVGDLNAAPAVADTNYHDYRLVRSGTTVTAYIDDEEYMTLTDAALGVEGMIGMGSYNDIAFFDDFKEGEGEPISVNNLNETEFQVYPNPAKDKLFVTSDSKIYKLVVSNITGQEVVKLNIIRSGQVIINTSQLESGMYFITVYGSGNHSATKKFIIE